MLGDVGISTIPSTGSRFVLINPAEYEANRTSLNGTHINTFNLIKYSQN